VFLVQQLLHLVPLPLYSNLVVMDIIQLQPEVKMFLVHYVTPLLTLPPV